MLRNISTGSETRVRHAISDVIQAWCSVGLLCWGESRDLFRGSTSREPGSTGRSPALRSISLHFLCSLAVVPVVFFIILIIGGLRSTLNFCNRRNITRYLCICGQHSVCTQHFFVIHFIVMATSYDTTFRVVSLIIVFATLFVLIFFSSVLCSRVDILCIFSTRNWYVLSLFNFYITCEKSDLNLCNSIATQWWRICK